jgi:flavodoxin I
MVKALVIYDSVHGNTEKIAQAIGEAIGARVFRVADVSPADLQRVDLLVVGAPTHAGNATKGINNFLKTLPALPGAKVAAFDTRGAKSAFGVAADKIAKGLEKAGLKLQAPPQGFIVKGIKGPLVEGELERAAGWAKRLIG